MNFREKLEALIIEQYSIVSIAKKDLKLLESIKTNEPSILREIGIFPPVPFYSDVTEADAVEIIKANSIKTKTHLQKAAAALHFWCTRYLDWEAIASASNLASPIKWTSLRSVDEVVRNIESLPNFTSSKQRMNLLSILRPLFVRSPSWKEEIIEAVNKKCSYVKCWTADRITRCIDEVNNSPVRTTRELRKFFPSWGRTLYEILLDTHQEERLHFLKGRTVKSLKGKSGPKVQVIGEDDLNRFLENVRSLKLTKIKEVERLPGGNKYYKYLREKSLMHLLPFDVEKSKAIRDQRLLPTFDSIINALAEEGVDSRTPLSDWPNNLSVNIFRNFAASTEYLKLSILVSMFLSEKRDLKDLSDLWAADFAFFSFLVLQLNITSEQQCLEVFPSLYEMFEMKAGLLRSLFPAP